MREIVQSWLTDPQKRVLLWAFALMAALVVYNVISHSVFGTSNLGAVMNWITNPESDREHADSWRPMTAALAWVRVGPDGSLYEEIFFNRGWKFQYPPTSFLPFVALEAIGIQPTAPVLNTISRVLVAATAAGVGWLSYILYQRYNPDAPSKDAHILLALFCAGATLLFYPIIYPYHIGQIQTWLNAAFVFACIVWLYDKRVAAGVLIGLICLIKPQFGLFAVWALWRKEWRFFAAMAATGLVALAFSIPLFGLANHFAYFEPLQFMARHGEVYAANQSVNGLLHHQFDPNPALQFSDVFAPHRPFVYYATLVTSLAILTAAFWGRARQANNRPLVDFMLAALAFTIASPIAWEFHYGVMAPMLAALFTLALTMPRGRAQTGWLLAIGACYAVAANGLTFTRYASETMLEFTQSYLLFAALALLAMLWRLTHAREGALQLKAV